MPAESLERRLSAFDAIALVPGAVIGSAIFLAPSVVLAAHGSPLAAVLVFLFGGILSLFGALAYAELGGMFPETGGEYVFLREAWGRPVAFLCGWSYFLVVQTGGIAAMAVGLAEMVRSILPFSGLSFRLCAVGLIAALTLLNYRGVMPGVWTGNVLTFCKVAGLTGTFAAVAFTNNPVPVDWSWPNDWTMPAFWTALVPVLWAYEGWNVLSFMAGEVRNPERNVPRALTAGLAVVITVYVASLWVYLRVLSVPEIIASPAVAPAAAMRALGSTGGTLVTVTMIIALIGATNASVLGVPRVYFAQARDGLFFRTFAALHPRFRTPSKALLLQCTWAMALAATGSYELLLSWCTFTAWVFYALCVAGVAILRRKEPGLSRPYRMWGYPWTAAAFLAIAIAFIAGAIATRPVTSLAGLLTMAAGAPFYWWWTRAAAKNPSPGSTPGVRRSISST